MTKYKYKLEVLSDKNKLILEREIRAADDINALILARKIVRALVRDKHNIISAKLRRWDIRIATELWGNDIRRAPRVFSLSRTGGFIEESHP